jgi:hypothetical protein
MINRPLWTQRIQESWKKRPIVWLSGVRRSGKTTLTRMFPHAIYQNCDLPSVMRQFVDPEPGDYQDRIISSQPTRISP